MHSLDRDAWGLRAAGGGGGQGELNFHRPVFVHISITKGHQRRQVHFKQELALSSPYTRVLCTHLYSRSQTLRLYLLLELEPYRLIYFVATYNRFIEIR